MKTKIIFIGLLLCVVAACNVTNSQETQKFNPHLDGLWIFHLFYPLPCELSTDNCGNINNYWYATVNYPTISLCRKIVGHYVRSSKDDSILSASSDSLKIKEEFEVAHTMGKYYKIKKINGNIVNGDSAILTKDTTTVPPFLTFIEIENGKKYSIGLYQSNYTKTSQAYKKCLREAVDTTGILTDTLQLDLGS